jgi:predicted flap endonuclease-1-like 5' DNA nuclease
MSETVEFPAGVGAPAARALVAAGYMSIDQLAGVSRSEMPALHGRGPKALRIIAEALAEQGTSLG